MRLVGQWLKMDELGMGQVGSTLSPKTLCVHAATQRTCRLTCILSSSFPSFQYEVLLAKKWNVGRRSVYLPYLHLALHIAPVTDYLKMQVSF